MEISTVFTARPIVANVLVESAADFAEMVNAVLSHDYGWTSIFPGPRTSPFGRVSDGGGRIVRVLPGQAGADEVVIVFSPCRAAFNLEGCHSMKDVAIDAEMILKRAVKNSVKTAGGKINSSEIRFDFIS